MPAYIHVYKYMHAYVYMFAYVYNMCMYITHVIETNLGYIQTNMLMNALDIPMHWNFQYVGIADMYKYLMEIPIHCDI